MSKAKALAGIKLKENRILIKKHELLTKTEGGIILPDDQAVQPEGGFIVAMGPGVEKDEYKIGEDVRYYEHGTTVDYKGDSYYLLRSTDIWASID
jgi:chaperonin GroES